MTGEKNRSSSVEKLWKVDDGQLTTPRHDAMVLSIIRNSKVVARNLGLLQHRVVLNTGTRTNTITRLKERVVKMEKELAEYEAEQEENLTGKKKYPRDRTDDIKKFTAGVNATHTALKLLEDGGEFNALVNSLKQAVPSYTVESEKPLVQRGNGFIIGYFDVLFTSAGVQGEINLYNDTTYHYQQGDIRVDLSNMMDTPRLPHKRQGYPDTCIRGIEQVAIEVKPDVRSFGETLRQLNTYRQHFDGPVVLCTDTDGLQDVFATQGIAVVSLEELLTQPVKYPGVVA